MKKVFGFLVFVSFFALFPFISYASAPVLFFSDIISGPDTGLGDGMGSGSIVTIWGANLGSTRGTSKVYFRDSASITREAAHVYYWCNANRTSGGGPADLYTYHKMQEIAFSIPDSATGLGKIYVTTDGGGTSSNELDFTVRSGNIKYCKSTGNDTTGNGSWGNPWKTYSSTSGQAHPASAGDIFYMQGSVTAMALRAVVGTAASPIAFITYPGTTYEVLNSSIQNYNASCSYVNFSKVRVESNGTGIGANPHMRIIGCEITDYPNGAGCADGQSGAISGGNLNAHYVDGGKYLGNYIHDFGCATTSNLHHQFYLSNRGGTAVEAYEIAWNYVRDGQARFAYHIYDEGDCGGWTGTFEIHDNVAVNQVQAGLNFNPCSSNNLNAYNNLLINCGLASSAVGASTAVFVYGENSTGHYRFYNNTIYGWPSTTGALSVFSQTWTFGGTYEWRNNIVVDTNNGPYLWYSQAPTVHTNNLWYNGGDGNPENPPSWDTSPRTSDPLFVNPIGRDFRLQSNSPAINVGNNAVSTVVKKDFLGVSRPQGSAFDIGAFEYDEGAPPPQPGPQPPQHLIISAP